MESTNDINHMQLLDEVNSAKIEIYFSFRLYEWKFKSDGYSVLIISVIIRA